jgi:hypothetical protein
MDTLSSSSSRDEKIISAAQRHLLPSTGRFRLDGVGDFDTQAQCVAEIESLKDPRRAEVMSLLEKMLTNREVKIDAEAEKSVA